MLFKKKLTTHPRPLEKIFNLITHPRPLEKIFNLITRPRPLEKIFNIITHQSELNPELSRRHPAFRLSGTGGRMTGIPSVQQFYVICHLDNLFILGAQNRNPRGK
jgi:hypothetical protein